MHGIAAVLLLQGCLTVRSVSVSPETQLAHERVEVEPDSQHLVAQEVLQSGQPQLQLSTAQRCRKVKELDLYEITTQGRDWSQHGKALRNGMWALSAASTVLGIVGIRIETDNGQVVQIGGLGADDDKLTGLAALTTGLGLLGWGTGSTVATKRSAQFKSHAGRLLELAEAYACEESPLAERSVELSLGADQRLLAGRTDALGRLTVPSSQLPTASWDRQPGVCLQETSSQLQGGWRPSDQLYQLALSAPPDWSAPFHSSLVQRIAADARQVGSASAGLPQLPMLEAADPGAVELRDEAAVASYLRQLPESDQVRTAARLLTALEENLERHHQAREHAQLSWLRTSVDIAQKSASASRV